MSDKENSDEEPDMRGPAVIVHGSVLGGFKFYGPFGSIDEAVAFWNRTLYSQVTGTNYCTIVLLEDPKALPHDCQ